MDDNVKILLNSKKNIKSVDADIYNKFELSNNVSEINEYDIRNAVSASEIFDAEREANEIYRIYGRIEYLSLLNGLSNDYLEFKDFFNPTSTDSKNILNSFSFYLVRPSTGYTKVINTRANWIRYFEVVATPSQFEIYDAGYSNNVYGEQTYAFNFNIDVDISYLSDNFMFPITELFLYVQYNKSYIATDRFETLLASTWSNTGVLTKTPILPIPLNVGDVVECANNIKISDIVEYLDTEYKQTQISEQEFYISTPIAGVSAYDHLIWKYKPLIPIRLRYLTDSLYQVNTGTTSYELLHSIPWYATDIGDGNFVWRNIMSEGYIDPLTGLGSDCPFVNKRRYLFTSLLLNIIPDLNDWFTDLKFAELSFGDDESNQNTTPIGDINDIGKPCK